MRANVCYVLWLVCAILTPLPALAGGASTDLSDIDAATRALMSKERARISEQKGSSESSSGSSSDKSGGRKGGCDMDVGNTDTRPGMVNSKPTPIIITGPVVQICK